MARFTALLVVVGLLAVSSFAAAKEPAGFKFAAKKKAPPPRRKSPPPHIPSKTCEDPFRAFKLLSKDGEKGPYSTVLSIMRKVGMLDAFRLKSRGKAILAPTNAATEASIRSLDFVKTARTMQPRQWNLTASNKAALMGVFGRMLVTPKQLWGSFRPSIRPTSCQLVATTYNLKNPLSHLVGGGRELWKGQLSLQPSQGKAGRRLHQSNWFEDANPCIGSQSYQLCNYNVFGLGSG